MATPTANSVSATSVNVSGLQHEAQALLIGTKWGGGLGTGVAMTYSFPTSAAGSFWASGYSVHNEYTSMNVLNNQQQAACEAAMTIWSRSANITFTKFVDSQTSCGEIRYAVSDLGNTTVNYAHAYYPGSTPNAGDVWFSLNWNSATGGGVTPGTYEFATILHELGHSLGLKHPFEGATTLSAAYDSYLYSIMSYNVHQGAPIGTVAADFYPTTPQYFDLLAIISLYGQSPNANPGNTTYTFNGTQHYWQTIDDVSGKDTIIYNSTTGGNIDLSSATFCQLGIPVHFTDSTVNYNTVALGPFTVIENATGGDGSDTITGNNGKNVLTGRGGADTIRGAKGVDKMNGGTGNDTFVYAATNDSKGVKFDTITGFDTAGDVFDLWFHIDAVNTAVTSGALSKASFTGDLTSALAGKLGAHSAVLFTPSSGGLDGKTFLVINPSGSAGYHSGSGVVILMNNGVDLAHLSAFDFI